MRTLLTVAAVFFIATVPAAAQQRWSDTQPVNPLAVPREPPPPTDADLDRREAAHHEPHSSAEDLAESMGLKDGSAELLDYRLEGEPDSSVRAMVDGGGAKIDVRW